ncbi:hypothetical protein OG352_05935 [Streptomyces sp. NBC_01485]|uniref:hypothetical protein n=1 Tax=Streptomyces sp. NBC_01485 TaxID=2903884 RepID=UPI002E2FDDFE|nr:hypothetical protein [Streptomyces sp. NBC_01485]
MDLTGGMRATVTAAGTILLGGLSTSLYGVHHDDLARSVGGAFLAVTALIFIALAVIRRWIIETGHERSRLADSERRAQDEHASYIALKAALENEQGRLRQDISAEHAALNERLKAERRKMEADFEEGRATLISETMEATVRMFHNGKFAPDTAVAGQLIPFPQQEPARQRERSRGHEVGGP